MKHFLDIEYLDPVDQPLLCESARRNTRPKTKRSDVFDLCLVLSVVFCVLELAVQLLRTKTCLQAVSLVLAVTIWAAMAAGIAIAKVSDMERLLVLCAAALVSDLLLLVSQPTATSVGFAMYFVDCFTKCILIMLILHTAASAELKENS